MKFGIKMKRKSKQIKSKTNKRRKNPKRVFSRFENLLFRDEIYEAIQGSRLALSRALSLLAHGIECKDCGQDYKYCTCEGDTIDKDIEGFNMPCRDCGFNYCVCDYDIDQNKLKEYAWKLAKENLDEKDFSWVTKRYANWELID